MSLKLISYSLNNSVWIPNSSFSENSAVGTTYDTMMHTDATSGNRIVLGAPITPPTQKFYVTGNTGYLYAIVGFDEDELYLGKTDGYIKEWTELTPSLCAIETDAAKIGIVLRIGNGTTALSPTNVEDVGFCIYYENPLVTTKDSLVVFGKTFTDVEGFRAKDIYDNTLSYTRGGGGSAIKVTTEQLPSGGEHKTISAVDLSNDTVNSEALIRGYTAHDSDGNVITGAASRGVDLLSVAAPVSQNTIGGMFQAMIDGDWNSLELTVISGTNPIVIDFGRPIKGFIAYPKSLTPLDELPTAEIDAFAVCIFNEPDDTGAQTYLYNIVRWKTNGASQSNLFNRTSSYTMTNGLLSLVPTYPSNENYHPFGFENTFIFVYWW